MKGNRLRWFRSSKGLRAPAGNADPDAQLLERLERKDELAFLQLYDMHHRAIFRFLMHMTGSIAAAEELTQEVFVAILDAMSAGTIGHFDPERGTWEGYLLGIARNLARAEVRKQRRVVSLDGILEAPEWDRLFLRLCESLELENMENLFDTRSDLTALRRAILELPNHYREALILCSLQEKSYRDAAVILHCREGTVASRINRAKAILVAKLRRVAPRTCLGAVRQESLNRSPPLPK
jgi:RNA polymerase sigma-70 factor, ECF subfamily